MEEAWLSSDELVLEFWRGVPFAAAVEEAEDAAEARVFWRGVPLALLAAWVVVDSEPSRVM